MGLAEPKSRRLTQPEIYTKNYYEERIKPALNKEIKAGTVEDSSKSRLLRTRQLSKLLLAAETDDIKKEIENQYKAQKKDSPNASSAETDPEKILRFVPN